MGLKYFNRIPTADAIYWKFCWCIANSESQKMYSLIAILCISNKIPEHLTNVELSRIGTELYILRYTVYVTNMERYAQILYKMLTQIQNINE